MKKYRRKKRIFLLLIIITLVSIVLYSLKNYLIDNSFELTSYLYICLVVYVILFSILVIELLGKIRINTDYLIIYFPLKVNQKNKNFLKINVFGIKFINKDIDCLYISIHNGTYLDPGDFFKFKIVLKNGTSFEGDFRAFGRKIEREILEALKKCSDLTIHF